MHKVCILMHVRVKTGAHLWHAVARAPASVSAERQGAALLMPLMCQAPRKKRVT
jgi:hypothetical protein